MTDTPTTENASTQCPYPIPLLFLSCDDVGFGRHSDDLREKNETPFWEEHFGKEELVALLFIWNQLKDG